MGITRLLCGKKMNWLNEGTVTVTDEDALFSKTNLGNGNPSQMFKFDSWGTKHIDVDTVIGSNGSLDSWADGAPVGWTKSFSGDGTVVETTTAGQFVSGSAAKLTNSTGYAAIQYDYPVRSSSRYSFRAKTRGDGSNGFAKLYLICLETGLYYNDITKSWQIAVVSIGTGNTTASYTESAKPLQIETPPASEVLGSLCTLRLIVLNDVVGTCYVDEIYLYQLDINFFSIHGHTIPPQVVVTCESKVDSAGSYTTRGTMVLAHPSCYCLLDTLDDEDPIRHRLWRITFTPASSIPPPFPAPISIGELVLGGVSIPDTQALSQEIVPFQWSEELPQLTNQTVAGVKWTYNRATKAPRMLTLSHRDVAAPALEDFRNEILIRSEYGSENILIIPDDERPEVLLGAIDNNVSWKNFMGDAVDRDLIIKELAFPVITP